MPLSSFPSRCVLPSYQPTGSVQLPAYWWISPSSVCRACGGWGWRYFHWHKSSCHWHHKDGPGQPHWYYPSRADFCQRGNSNSHHDCQQRPDSYHTCARWGTENADENHDVWEVTSTDVWPLCRDSQWEWRHHFHPNASGWSHTAATSLTDSDQYSHYPISRLQTSCQSSQSSKERLSVTVLQEGMSQQSADGIQPQLWSLLCQLLSHRCTT